MKRLRTLHRRGAIVIAGMVLGLVGAATLAGLANATPAGAQPAGPAGPAEPTGAPAVPGVPVVTEDFSCEQLRIIVTNPPDGVPVTVTITTSRGDSESGEIAPGEEFVGTFSGANSLTYEVTVDGVLLADGGWDRCDETPDEFPFPQITPRSDCDSITIVVTNVESGRLAVVEFMVGDVSEARTVPLGETIEVTFPAERGTSVIVGFARSIDHFDWVEPAGCDDGPGLPVTGASTGLVAGAAIASLVVGAGAFLAARRRRITFTA